ncbi:hypothetical protein AtubIFM57258_002859 [Aspergillus tubingensis]|nr:hypothetical protein AtubIFM57258_002859 [Aspergillus tubingensis]
MGASNLVVSRVSLTSEGEWDELIAGYWASWLDPFQATGELTFAHLGTGSPAEQKAFSKVKNDLLNQARSDPDNTVWLKCVDVQLKRIIGGGMYKIYRSNPYRAGAPTPVADWFPDGSEKRALAEAMYRQLWAWRAKLMTEKHFCKCFGNTKVNKSVTLPNIESQVAAHFGPCQNIAIKGLQALYSNGLCGMRTSSKWKHTWRGPRWLSDSMSITDSPLSLRQNYISNLQMGQQAVRIGGGLFMTYSLIPSVLCGDQ